MTNSTAVRDCEKTMAAKPGDPFYVDVATTENELVRHGKQDSPRIQFLKTDLPMLIKTISDTDPKVTVLTLKAELAELLHLFRSIFDGKKQEEINVLRLCLQQLGISGEARILLTIADCSEIDDEVKKLMKKLILKKEL